MAVLLAWALLAPALLAALFETDLGWHLAIGAHIAAGAIPRSNELSWIAEQHPWYATSWAYDWLIHGLISWGGIGALQAFHLALLGAVLVLLEGSLAALGHARMGLLLLPLLALQLHDVATFRPELVSWAVLAGVARALVSNHRYRHLLVAVLIAGGGNFHAGAIYALVLAGTESVALFVSGERRLAVAAAVGAGVAFLCNPGGLFNIQYVLTHLALDLPVPLTEFAAISLPRQLDALLIVGAVAWSGYRLRSRLAPLWIASLALGLMGLRTVRLLPPHQLLAVIPIAVAVAEAWSDWGVRTRRLAGVGLVALSMQVHNYVPALFGARFGAEWDPASMPVVAARWIQAHPELPARVFNSMEDGGFLESALPWRRWFLDGRVQAFPPSLFREEREAWSSPATFSAFLDRHQVEWMVLPRVEYAAPLQGLLDSAQWALVHWDGTSAILIRRGVELPSGWLEREEYRMFRPIPGLRPPERGSAPFSRLAEEVGRYLTWSPDDARVAQLRERLR